MALPPVSPTSIAVVTGSSQGIGRAIAKDLASLGYNLMLVARRENVLEELAKELRAHGVTVHVYPADLADKEQLMALVEKLEGLEVSMIVNSAGIASFGRFMDQDLAYERNQFNLNARAVFELTRAVLPGMLERKSGTIINVGSVAGNMPIPNNATYVFTKAGVNAFTEALHYELKASGITCTLLAPGPVREAVVPDEEKTIVDRVVPDFLWTTYESCSKETLEAAVLGKRRVVPGPLSKTMDVISGIIPTAIMAPVMGWFYKKMAQ